MNSQPLMNAELNDRGGKEGLSALVFGATGAIGAELILHLLRSNKWVKVHVVVRRQLQEWKSVPGREKLVIQKVNDLDQYFKQPNDHYKHINAVFFSLGSEVGKGEDLFIKVDKTYALMAADIAIKNNVPNYHYLSSNGGNATSCLLYLRVKGEAEDELKEKKVRVVSIHKPGLLVGRRQPRTGQKIAGCLCCCFPHIQASDCADVMRLVAQRNISNLPKEHKFQVFQNGDMVEIADQNRL